MARNYQQYLDTHEGNAEEALKAAVRDVAQRESQNTAARAFKRAYSPLIESLKLPQDVDTDSEQEAQTLAARALDSLGQPAADEETEAVIDALQAIIETYADATGIDLPALLDGLPESATDDDVTARIDEAFAPLTALQDRATRADLQDAAAFAGKPVEALADYLEGKTWGRRTVKAEDGSEREEWGIGEGEKFKPLTAVPGLQAIASVQPDKPAPAPLPTGQRGGTPKPKTAEDIASEKRSRPEYTI
ncbi:hypothetical protein DEIPH_ctg011orf0021 [Deinococcus phoenicis]|uniref:Uncharacterized protein n=1 Tax=Deinococcus phoenicis TaxID=1476583 RepID=A0A016QSW1_9DEIO|nr:hypothetical protein [Deinococcus phoenicis]EYB69056.1 hypothetical protein DEIPH_ctg011orf0021 [Deinococcus phoenicis]